MEPVILNLLADEDFREAIAERAYYRERQEDAARDREHDLDEDVSYYALEWGSLSDESRRPYRTAVHEALNEVLDLA